MSKAPPYWTKARTYLSKKDSIMRSLIKKYKDNNLTTRKDVFYSLCKSIIGQQISVAAADSVAHVGQQARDVVHVPAVGLVPPASRREHKRA